MDFREDLSGTSLNAGKYKGGNKTYLGYRVQVVMHLGLKHADASTRAPKYEL